MYVVTLTDGVATIADGVITTKLGISDTKLNSPIYDKDPTNLDQSIAKRIVGNLGMHKVSLKHLFRRGNKYETRTNREK